MPFIDRPGAQIHWQEAGSGTPLLLIMGLRFSSAMWYPVIPSHSAGHRVVWFDNQGTGQSGARKSTSVAEMADDALAVMDAAGIDAAHVYGVSMGGGLAMELALRAPERVRSLILGCTAIKTELLPAPKPIAKAIFYVPRFLYGHGPLKMDALYGPAAPAAAKAKDLAMLKADRADVSGVFAQASAIAAYAVDKSKIAALDIPTLVVHGTADKTVPYAAGEDIAATIPGARLVTIEGAGHNYFVADAEKSNSETLAFLAGVDAASPVESASTAR